MASKLRKSSPGPSPLTAKPSAPERASEIGSPGPGTESCAHWQYRNVGGSVPGGRTDDVGNREIEKGGRWGRGRRGRRDGDEG